MLQAGVLDERKAQLNKHCGGMMMLLVAFVRSVNFRIPDLMESRK